MTENHDHDGCRVETNDWVSSEGAVDYSLTYELRASS